MAETKVCVKCRIRYRGKTASRFVGDRCPWCAEGVAQAWVGGVSNETRDGFFVPFWDFDETPLGEVMDGLLRLQDRYRLGPVLVLRSSPGDNYQAVAFTKWGEHACRTIIGSHPREDRGHLLCWRYRGHTTLRTTAKRQGVPISLVLFMKSRSRTYGPTSQAHIEFFARRHMPLLTLQVSGQDGLKELRWEGFRSRHVGEQHMKKET